MEKQSEDMLFNLIKVYLAQMDSAVKISAVISEHSDREELTGDDIICGLVYRLMIPMSQSEIDDSMNKADEILNNEDEEEEEDDDIVEETYEKSTLSREIKSNQCNCDICSKVRICLANYHSFEPNDQLAERFKKSIQKTCDEHRIYI